MTCPEAEPGQELERHRSFLMLLARLHTADRLEGKIDLSGVVQQTIFEAQREKARIEGQPPERLMAWLRQILSNNLRDEIRKLFAQGRDVRRERSLERELEKSSARLEAFLAADQSSPSEQAMRSERLLALADALGRLSDDQREAVELHHLRGWPLADVARQLNRSPGAAAALLFRAIKKLRELMAETAEA